MWQAIWLHAFPHRAKSGLSGFRTADLQGGVQRPERRRRGVRWNVGLCIFTLLRGVVSCSDSLTDLTGYSTCVQSGEQLQVDVVIDLIAVSVGREAERDWLSNTVMPPSLLIRKHDVDRAVNDLSFFRMYDAP